MSSLLGSQQQWIQPTDAASRPRCSCHTRCLNVCANPFHLMNFDASVSRPNIDIISQFVTLVTAACAPIAPPVVILGLSYMFVRWLSTACLENMYATLPVCMIWHLSKIARHEVQRLLIAYTVDLISVLRELFDLTLQPNKALATTWQEVKEAFEAYERSLSRQKNHNSICSKSARGQQIITADGISEMVRDLVMKYLWNRGGDEALPMTLFRIHRLLAVMYDRFFIYDEWYTGDISFLLLT